MLGNGFLGFSQSRPQCFVPKRGGESRTKRKRRGFKPRRARLHTPARFALMQDLAQFFSLLFVFLSITFP